MTAPCAAAAPPLVSVVMPFKDPGAFFDEAVQSVLHQTWEPLELVLVDDGGSDGSDQLAHRLAATDTRVRVINHEGRANRGTGPSRALGIRHSTGDLVAFLDSDDVWESGHMADQVSLLSAHPEADMVCGRVWEWRSWNDRTARDTLSALAFAPGVVVPGPRLLAAVLRHGGLATTPCALLVRTALLRKCIADLDKFPSTYEDQVINSALQLRGTAVMSGSASAWYRQHPNSLTARDAARPEPHDGGRTAYLTWLRAEVARLDPRDPEVPQLVDRALEEVPFHLPEASRPRSLTIVRGRTPESLRRVVSGVERRVGARLSAPAAARVHAQRAATLLARHGADVRGDVLALGGSAAVSGLWMTSVHEQPWPNTQGIGGPHHEWTQLPTARWDCVVATPDVHAVRRPWPIRHLRRVLRPGGVLLILTGPEEERRLTTELGQLFGSDAVSIEVQTTPGPRTVPLLLLRAAVPAT
ncbi:glycosyltransferase family 2 protein [Geodermatophilus sp. SYSU D01186]